MYKTKNIEKWLGYEFEPVECKTGKDFTNFARNIKAEINAQIKDSGCEMVSFNKGYFDLFGFIHNSVTGKYVYFSTGDVRYDNDWYKHILFRSARNDKDYTGGMNRWTTLENLGLSVCGILCECSHYEFAA